MGNCIRVKNIFQAPQEGAAVSDRFKFRVSVSPQSRGYRFTIQADRKWADAPPSPRCGGICIRIELSMIQPPSLFFPIPLSPYIKIDTIPVIVSILAASGYRFSEAVKPVPIRPFPFRLPGGDPSSESGCSHPCGPRIWARFPGRASLPRGWRWSLYAPCTRSWTLCPF